MAIMASAPVSDPSLEAGLIVYPARPERT
jgi:hypothetical protein